MRSTVRMAESAICPLVISAMAACASPAVTACPGPGRHRSAHGTAATSPSPLRVGPSRSRRARRAPQPAAHGAHPARHLGQRRSGSGPPRHNHRSRRELTPVSASRRMHGNLDVQACRNGDHVRERAARSCPRNGDHLHPRCPRGALPPAEQHWSAGQHEHWRTDHPTRTTLAASQHTETGAPNGGYRATAATSGCHHTLPLFREASGHGPARPAATPQRAAARATASRHQRSSPSSPSAFSQPNVAMMPIMHRSSC
jgi:hypothetical protein